MSIPKLRVDTPEGYELVATTGALDFDGGSLIVWRDERRAHIVKAYGPLGWISCNWEGADGQVRAE